MTRTCITLLQLAVTGLAIASGARRPNVLFIAVDDLRPEINSFGADYMLTPNLDRLVKRGVGFQRAYCQQAVSAPSRNSMLTGLRPDNIGIYDLSTFFRTKVPDVVTLPQHFRENGYQVETVGKIYHIHHGNEDDSLSWSVPSWQPNQVLGKLTPITRGDTTKLESDYPEVNGVRLPFYASPEDLSQMSDARAVEVAIRRMEVLKDSAFFMAIGFSKPHLPFVAPTRFWELYPPDDIIIPDRSPITGIPVFSFGDFGELRNYHGMPKKGAVDDDTSRQLIQGYRASVSMIDELTGKLMEALERLGLADNTIIVLWSDHGYKLGEFGLWCKHSNHEYDTNAPLIIAAPGYKGNQLSSSIVEFIDIFPTLCELAGLEKPAHLQGVSLVPVLRNQQAIVKNVALSQYPRPGGIMGYSVCNKKFRYTRWVNRANTNEVLAEELHQLSGKINIHRNLIDSRRYRRQKIQLKMELDALL